MKRIFFIAAASAGMFGLASCMQNIVVGKGDKVTEQRAIQAFTSIEISAPVDAIITMDNGASPTLELNGYKNVFAHIKTEIKGNTLHIFTDKNVRIDNDRGVDILIRMPQLSGISISGASDVEVKNTITGDEFSLTVSGAGDIDIDDVNVKRFVTDLSGAGDLTIKKGTAEQANYQLSGAGDIDAYSLVAKNVIASVSGVGDIKLNATESLDASVSGAGSIDYKGHPVVKSDKSGVGSIEDTN